MKGSTKVIVGVAVAGGLGAFVYALLKGKPLLPSSLPLIASDPYEWKQYTAPVLPPPNVAENTASPDTHVDIQVIPLFSSTGASLQPYGGKCTLDSQCASGVCINGTCHDSADWDA